MTGSLVKPFPVDPEAKTHQTSFSEMARVEENCCLPAQLLLFERFAQQQ